MQVRLVAKQAPALVWSHQYDQPVTFQKVLQSYCDKYKLDSQFASLTDSQGTAITLSEVVQKSAVLLVHFQPSWRFFIWYHLYTLCPQPVIIEWLASFDARGAVQHALSCTCRWDDEADPLTTLLFLMPQQLLPHGMLDSSLPLTALTADSKAAQAHPVFWPGIKFLTGIRQYVGSQTPAQHDPLPVISRLQFLRALLLIQHLLCMVRPVGTHLTEGPESILVEVLSAFFRHAPATLGLANGPLAKPASLAEQVHQVEPTSWPSDFSQSETAFPEGSETQRHIFAVVQLSDRLLRFPIEWVLKAPAFKRSSWPLLHPTVSAMAVAFRWSDSSGVLSYFTRLGGYQWPVQLLKAGHRTEAYRLLHEMQCWFPNKLALSIEQRRMLMRGFLPLAAAHLQPQYVVGEEREAEAGRRAFGGTQQQLLAKRPPSQLLHLQQTADVLMTFITAQSGGRKTTYSLDVAKPVGLQIFEDQYAEYKCRLCSSVTQHLPDGLSEQMDALHKYITLPTEMSGTLCTEADDASVASHPSAPPPAAALSSQCTSLQPTTTEMPNGNAHTSIPSDVAAGDTTSPVINDTGTAATLTAPTAAMLTASIHNTVATATADTAATGGTAAVSSHQPVPGQNEAASNPAQPKQLAEPGAALRAAALHSTELAQGQVNAAYIPQQTDAALSAPAKPDTGPIEASAPWVPTGAEVNAILSAMANSGVHEMDSKHIYQQHWPSPHQQTWGATVKLAIQLAAVMDWVLRQQIPPDMIRNDSFISIVAADYKLKNSLIALLCMLLVGHMLDMSLDVVPLFQSTFHAVMKMWVSAEALPGAESLIQKVGFSVDVTRISQLGQAMLKRLALDAPLRTALISSASSPGWQRRNLVTGIVNMLALQRHTQHTAGKLTVPIGAMHPDWQVMLDVLYGFIANQSFPAHELLAAQPPMPTEIASNITFLKFNSAARTTAAALFCHLTQLRSKRDAVDEAKLDSSDIRFMYKTLQTMHYMLTDPPEVDEQSCVITARLLHHFNSLYCQLPKALQEGLLVHPVTCESDNGSNVARHVNEGAFAIRYGLGPAECMRVIHAATRPKQTEAIKASVEAPDPVVPQPDDLDACHDELNRAKAELAAVSEPEEPILMNRLAWTRAVLQYLGQVVLAATKQQWSAPHYQLVTDAIIRLLQSLCPPVVFADTSNHGAYLAVFEETQAAQVLTDVMSAWLHYTTVDVEWTMLQDLQPLVRKPTLLVAELLAYLQGTVLQPQYAHLGHYPYFGEKCFSGCLRLFADQSNEVARMHTSDDLDIISRGPQLSAFAVCVEQSHLFEPPEDAAPGFPIAALNPCLTWTFKLLEMLLHFHAQQQGLTKVALENHKQHQRLLKLMDKQIPDEVAEERDRVLEESVTTKETVQAQRRHVTESYSRASAELDRMLAAGRTMRQDPNWAFHLTQDRQRRGELVKIRTDRLLAGKVLPIAKVDDIHAYFGLTEVAGNAQAEALGEAEEEQSKAKAAAKKAKKQRQKAKKGQQALPDTSPNPASPLKPAASPGSTEPPDSDDAESPPHGLSPTRPPSPWRHTSSAVVPHELASTAGLAQPEQNLQHLDSSTDEDSLNSRFLEELFCCPLTKVLMVDPVIAADGHTYERAAIQQWLQTSVASPVTSLPLAHTRLVPNVLVKSAIQTQMPS